MTDPVYDDRRDVGSSLGDQDVFIGRHGRTFTIVITVVSAVIVVPLSGALLLLSGFIDDNGRWGMRIAGVALLGVPAFFWGVTTLVIRIRSGLRR